MILLGLDPGTTHSAIVQIRTSGHEITDVIPWKDCYTENGELADDLHHWPGKYNTRLIVETMASSYGRSIDKNTTKTLVWSGRLIEAWRRGNQPAGHPVELRDFDEINRTHVKVILTGVSAIDDAGVNAVLYNRFGGDRKTAVGTKKSPGPCHNVKGHGWQALAAAVAWHDRQLDPKRWAHLK